MVKRVLDHSKRPNVSRSEGGFADLLKEKMNAQIVQGSRIPDCRSGDGGSSPPLGANSSV